MLMKRSEAILKIKKMIWEGENMLGYGHDYDEIADVFLDSLENELKMLPPQNPNVDNYSLAMGSNANFWEEEEG